MGLLNSAEKEKIKHALPKAANKIIDVTVARLYIAYPDSGKWVYTGLSGAIVLVDDVVGNTFFLKLVDIHGHRGVLWDQELYVNFQYNQDRTFFHSFELEKCYAGLLFADTNEASHFLKRVQKREKYGSKKTLANKNAIALEDQVKKEEERQVIHGPRGESLISDQRVRYRYDADRQERAEDSGHHDYSESDSKMETPSIPVPVTSKAPPPPPPVAPPSHSDIPSYFQETPPRSDSPSTNNSSTDDFQTPNATPTPPPASAQTPRPVHAVPPPLPADQYKHVAQTYTQPQVQQPPHMPPPMPQGAPYSHTQQPGTFAPPPPPGRALPQVPGRQLPAAPGHPPAVGRRGPVPPPPPRRSAGPAVPARGAVPPPPPPAANNQFHHSGRGPPPPPPPRRGPAPAPPPRRDANHAPPAFSMLPTPQFQQQQAPPQPHTLQSPPTGQGIQANGYGAGAHIQNTNTPTYAPPPQHQPIQIPPQNNSIPAPPPAPPMVNSIAAPPPAPPMGNSIPAPPPAPPMGNYIPAPPPAPPMGNSIPAPPPAPPMGNSIPPPPPSAPTFNQAAPATTFTEQTGDAGRDALLASIRGAGGIAALKKVDKSQLERPNPIIQEARGNAPADSHSSNGTGPPPPGAPASLADALAAALNQRKSKVAKDDDYDNGDDW